MTPKPLAALIESGRIPHAMVLDGGTQDSRRELARTVAQAILCTSETGKPCQQCTACRKVAEQAHPDVLEVEPEAGRKTLSVDVIRRMREDAFILPNESDHKVYIIPQADLMQDYAQNALLKILEEPPRYATFILCCESRSSLLPTVLSRTAQFSLSGEDEPDTLSESQEEALALAKTLADATARGREMDLLSAAAPLEKSYDSLQPVLEQYGRIVRDALILRAGSDHLVSGAPDEATRLSRACDTEQLLELSRAAEEISNAVTRHANKNLTLTRLCSRIAAAVEQQ